MKFKKLIASLVVMGVLSSVFVGCTGKTEPDKTDSDKTVQVQENNLTPEGLPILKEPEVFTVAVKQVSPTQPNKNKEIVKRLEEETNIKFEWIEIPISSWEEKVNIMFASGDLPDLFMSNIDTALYYEQLVAVDDMIDNSTPNIQRLLENEKYAKALKAPDGKIHQLPAGDESIHNISDKTTWINETWLDTLGLEMPTTTDEYYNVLKAFKEQDPNGNGIADEIPLTFNGVGNWATGMGDLFGPFGVLESEKHVYMDEGKVVFGAQEQGYYDALEWFHKLFSEGLIDQEAFSHSAEQYNAKGKGKDIIGSAIAWRANVITDADVSEQYTYMLPLKGPDGAQMALLNDLTQTQGYAITTACKNPEALVRLYDYANSSPEMIFELSRGIEDSFWKKVGDDKYMLLNLPENTPEGVEFPKWREEFSLSHQSPSLWTLDIDNSLVDNPDAKPDLKKIAVKDTIQFGLDALPNGSDTIENSERRSMILADIQNYLTKFVADSVMNGIDEAKWNEHLKNMESLRVEEYVSLCQEYVDRMAE